MTEVDFRHEYSIGMHIYYIWINELTGTKTLYELIISSVYKNKIIGWEPKGCAHIIGAEDSDNIYTERNVAEAFFKQTTVTAKYGG